MSKDIKGKIHSIESFGTVDGPGIRFVIFLQGCPMRCLYCHNPDTWNMSDGDEMSAEELIKEYEKNRAFYTKGGITVTGGEPLLQVDFVTELFRLAKKKNIHTAIDTSGITYTNGGGSLDELMKYTDLVMLDVKHIDPEKHKALTGHSNERILAFTKYLEEKNMPVWIRHVVIEGYTDGEADLYELGRFIGGLKNLKALDVLPYHTMGKAKYEEMGLEYPLANVPPLTASAARVAKEHILRGVKAAREKI